MEHRTIAEHCLLLNHLTTIKLALELLARDTPLCGRQRDLVETALTAADRLAEELADR